MSIYGGFHLGKSVYEGAFRLLEGKPSYHSQIECSFSNNPNAEVLIKCHKEKRKTHFLLTARMESEVFRAAACGFVRRGDTAILSLRTAHLLRERGICDDKTDDPSPLDFWALVSNASSFDGP